MSLVKGTYSNYISVLCKYRKKWSLGSGIFQIAQARWEKSPVSFLALLNHQETLARPQQDTLFRFSRFLKKKKVLFRSIKGWRFVEGLACMNSNRTVPPMQKYCCSKADGNLGLSVELLKCCFRSSSSYTKQRTSWTFLTHSKSLLRLVKEMQLLRQANRAQPSIKRMRLAKFEGGNASSYNKFQPQQQIIKELKNS